MMTLDTVAAANRPMTEPHAILCHPLTRYHLSIISHQSFRHAITHILVYSYNKQMWQAGYGRISCAFVDEDMQLACAVWRL